MLDPGVIVEAKANGSSDVNVIKRWFLAIHYKVEDKNCSIHFDYVDVG